MENTWRQTNISLEQPVGCEANDASDRQLFARDAGHTAKALLWQMGLSLALSIVAFAGILMVVMIAQMGNTLRDGQLYSYDAWVGLVQESMQHASGWIVFGVYAVTLFTVIIANVTSGLLCANKTGVKLGTLFHGVRPGIKLFSAALVLLFGAQFIGQCIYVLLNMLLEQVGLRADPFSLDLPPDTFSLIFYCLTVCIAAPVTEEFLFRGVLLKSLSRYGNLFAAVISSLLFGIMHGNFQQMPFAFMIGLVLSYLVLKTGSIQYAILLHLINNTVSTVLLLVIKQYEHNTWLTDQMALYELLLLSACFMISVIVLIGYRKKIHFISHDQSDIQAGHRISIRHPYIKYFTQPWVIVFMLVGIALMIYSVF